MFRESVSSFVLLVDTAFIDESSHLFPTRSLLTSSAAYLSISFTSMRFVFTPRRLITLECCLVPPWVTASDVQSNIAEWRPAVSLTVLHVNGAAVDCTASCAGSAGWRKTLPRRELRCTSLFSLTHAAMVLATLAASSSMKSFDGLESCVWVAATINSQTEWTELPRARSPRAQPHVSATSSHISRHWQRTRH